MSRIGKRPVHVPDKVKVDLAGSVIKVTGPKGALEHTIHPDMTVTIKGSEVAVTRPSDLKKHRALHGLTRALIQNMTVGVSKGFNRQLQIVGVGFRAEVRGKALILYLGFSHPTVVVPPAGVNVSVDAKENKITVEGIDKELVGQTAAKIRSLRPPEPYKGKGVRYVDEQVRQKAGKTAG
ncbi:50S ribosomal protein L6 [candidate division GN15 bacterium]|uniref:Large ribosomal subunit protein uL6 n=1 Tax=candidate division GN15 bacterium TaxID=2072418 RepID=A0A855X7P5_9BACT|nr:MAG: 50S ribosomal protein L6 [candidate division GN15 bacterium]